MKYYLYNPLANNGIRPEISPEHELIDATKTDFEKFFSSLREEDEVVLIGGDGTINYLVNHYDCSKLKNRIFLLANGTGNDFLKDIGEEAGKEIELNRYLTGLPTVKVGDIERKFINNMGFGIDGYCCEVADQIKEKTPNKKINYTAIAIKGLLFFFKPCHATIEVDGRTYEYDNVWLAPTMKGRFYGGGMMIAPKQDRLSDTLSVVVYMTPSKLKALMAFPSIFEGKHVEKTDMVKVMEGKNVHVKFSRPCAAQIDGDTVLNVTEYWASI
jgi:diacylglycerol kinase family enzyme